MALSAAPRELFGGEWRIGSQTSAVAAHLAGDRRCGVAQQLSDLAGSSARSEELGGDYQALLLREIPGGDWLRGMC